LRAMMPASVAPSRNYTVQRAIFDCSDARPLQMCVANMYTLWQHAVDVYTSRNQR
jgi:hypothetical protein